MPIHSVGGPQNLIPLMKKTVKFSEIPTDAILYAEKVATHINSECTEHFERLVNIVAPEMRQAIELKLTALHYRDEVAEIQESINYSKKELKTAEDSAKRLRDGISTLEKKKQEKAQKLDEALKKTDEIPDRFKELFENQWKN